MNFDKLYRRSGDSLHEPDNLVAVLVISPDQQYMGPTQIKTHRRSLGAISPPDNREYRVRSQLSVCHNFFALHHSILLYANAGHCPVQVAFDTL